ncbi:MAG: hypothetical protein AAGA20_20830, partial [Planctomycetota bacterium]
MGGHLGKNVVIAASLVAAGFLGAWLRFTPYLGAEGAFTDGERTVEIEGAGALRYAVWDEPQPLGGALNTDESERAPALSPDGRSVVFVVGERGRGTDLWIADLDARGVATDPRPLAGVNSPSDEVAPAFSTTGSLYFASNRPGGAGGLDLWRADVIRGVFTQPGRLGGTINGPSDDTDPAPVPWSDEIVFASRRERPDEPRVAALARDFDLFTARPLPPDAEGDDVWDVEPLDEVNSPFDERDPCVAADGRALLFASDRGSESEDFDLFRAARTPRDADAAAAAVAWLPPAPLEGVNSSADERHPRSTADGFALLFSREDAVPATDSGWDVWRARSRELTKTPGRPIGWREILVLAALLLLALLAALAKRWSALDVIYRAFLISLLIHLALLWWFGDVVPESEPQALRAGDDTRVRVRLVEDPSSLAAQRNRELSGAVEVARAERESADAPELAEAQPLGDEPEVAPAADVAFERSVAELAAAPAQEFVETERSAQARTREAEVQALAESIERRSGAAPSLEVAARATEVVRESEAASPEQVAPSESRREVRPTVSSRAAPELTRAARDAAAAPERDTEDANALARAGTRVTADVEVDAASESITRFESDVSAAGRPLAVEASRAAEVAEREAREETVARASDLEAQRPEEGTSVAPTALDPLERSRGGSPNDGPPAPAFVAAAPRERTAAIPRPGVDVRSADEAAPPASARSSSGEPAAFDALAELGGGSAALDRSRAEFAGPAAPRSAPSSSEPGALRPDAGRPLERAVGREERASDGPAVARAAPPVERSAQAPRTRDVELGGPTGPANPEEQGAPGERAAA